jgi:hypothetical protein
MDISAGYIHIENQQMHQNDDFIVMSSQNVEIA